MADCTARGTVSAGELERDEYIRSIQLWFYTVFIYTFKKDPFVYKLCDEKRINKM